MIAVHLMKTVSFATVASPGDLAMRGRLQVPQDLHRHDCVCFRFDSGLIYRWRLERHGIVEIIDVKEALTLPDQILMVDTAIDGIGVAFVPDFLVIDALKTGTLECVFDDWCPAFPGVCSTTLGTGTFRRAYAHSSMQSNIDSSPLR